MVLPFHAGELAAQAKAGTRGVAAELKAGQGDKLSFARNHDAFLASQTFAVVTSVVKGGGNDDDQHDVWVTPILGAPGSMIARSETEIAIHHTAVPVGDILRQAKRNASVSMLGIDLMKRTRHRINGVVSGRNKDASVFGLSVKEYSPNCPKYINRRELVLPAGGASIPSINTNATRRVGTSLDESDQRMIVEMDTLFIGTNAPGVGADTNHRGGKPGFVRVNSPNKISWPEYRGNGMFYTSGNLEVNDRAGVTFIDFETGDVLQLSGSAVVDWNHDGTYEGATRAIEFTIESVVRVTEATNYRWKLVDFSPYNPTPFGRQDLKSAIGYPIDVTLTKIVNESPKVTTFRWVATRNIAFLPAQYASFEFGKLPGSDEDSHIRTWTLSETPNSVRGDNTLDISVKRKPGGLVTNWLHDHAQVGMTLRLHGVQGEMTPIQYDVKNKNTPPTAPENLLLISAGIGITPSLAVVRGLGAFELQESTHINMIHMERHREDLPFQGELMRRARQYASFRMTNIVSSEQGRLTKEQLRELVPQQTAKQVAYVCGPPQFMTAVTQYLVDMGVPAANIHTENFDF